MSVPKETVIAILARTNLFADFSPEELVSFLGKMDQVQVEAGETVFNEGEVGDAWYVIISGEAAVVRDTESGPPYVVNTLERGDSFGEMALLDGARRSASIEAVEDLALARLSKSDFDAMIRDNDPAATRLLLGMARELCKRQRQLTWLMQDLVDFEEPGPEDQALLEALRQALPGA